MRIAAIDQGTTSTRCIIVEDGGDWQFAGSARHQQYHPAASWVEHDPEELLANVRSLLAKAGNVDAIGLAHQGESCMAWDAKTCAPLSRVIVWQDARTAAHLASLPPGDHEVSRTISGLPLDPYFSASKLGWLFSNVPAVKEAHEEGRLRLGTTDAFFLNALTGRFITDLATASRTGLLDLATRDWSIELCNLHGVPIEALPTIVKDGTFFGEINSTPVRASTVDQQAALFGHGCRQPGDCKITFGTGGFLLAIAEDQRPAPSDLTPTLAWSKNDGSLTYALEGGVYDAGAAVEWARKIGLFTDLEQLVSFSGPSALSRGIIFVPALSGLAAPYWDRNAGAMFIGMEHATTNTDLARAVLEGVAMLTVGLINAVPHQATPDSVISIDGGLSQNAYFAQFLASASGRRIKVPSMHELTALGLAELCGLDVSATRENARVYVPDGSVVADHHAAFQQAIERSRNWRSNT